MTVLAGDIGGTNSRLAIYDVPSTGLRGVKPIFEQTYPSAAHASHRPVRQADQPAARDELEGLAAAHALRGSTGRS